MNKLLISIAAAAASLGLLFGQGQAQTVSQPSIAGCIAGQACQASTMAIGGATIGSNALAVAGTISVSGLSDTTSGGSVAIGAGALTAQSALTPSAFHNTAVGYQSIGAAGLTTSAQDVTGVGYQTLSAITTAAEVSAFGSGAGTGVTTGSSSNYFGWHSGHAITTGQFNNAFGNATLGSITTGSGNTAMGDGVMENATTTAQYNAGFGTTALDALTTGNYNAAFGSNAGRAITTGQRNLVLGPDVGSTTLTTGQNNILLGNSNAVDTAASNTNQYLNIGNILDGDMSNVTTIANKVLSLKSIASSVNWLQVSSSATGVNVAMLPQGTDSNIGLSISGKGTSPVAIAPLTSTNPGLIGDTPGTGFSIGSSINVVVSSTNRWQINTSGIASAAGSAKIGSGTTGATSPVFIPNQSDTKAGIGADAAGDVSLISNVGGAATETLRAQSGVTVTIPKTVTGLPSCVSGLDGARSFVTDATATTFASTVAGSGSNHVPVYCDGSGTPAWKIGQNDRLPANDNDAFG